MSEFLLRKLSSAVSSRRLNKGGFEALSLGLRGQQQRLFLHLADKPQGADTIELRNECSIGNISEAAVSLNAKLAAQGDNRRVVCSLSQHKNRYGENGTIGHWRLVEPELAAA